MKKLFLLFFLILLSFGYTMNCSCDSFKDCVNKYNSALFYENYSQIICYGKIILSRYNDSIYNYDKESIEIAISHAFEKLNKTDISKKLLRDAGFIIEDNKKHYFKHFDNQKKENIKQNNDVMIMLFFMLVIIICLYLLYLEKSKNKGGFFEKL